MEPGSTISPVAKARPNTVNSACTGLRSMFLKAMRSAGPLPRVRPMRSRIEGLKSAGGSGRIASAGGSFTAIHTTETTPRSAATVLTTNATPSAL